jgi:predicted Zn-dependent protease
MVSLARQYLEKGDGRNAMLCLQQALRANPKNLDAVRLMAGLMEASRSPGALLWRSRVVELNPQSVEDRLALAQTALMMRDYASATNALEGVPAAGKQTAAYHNLAGTLASTVNQLPEAEAHFLEAARLDPTNAAPRLNLAVIQLQRTNAPAQLEARASLRQLATDPTLRCQAMRELIGDAMRHKQTNDALALTKELLLQTNSAFSDRLLRLDVLQASQNPEFPPALAAFQREATNAPGKIYELGMWQASRISSTNALAWLRSLPLALQTNQPVTMLVADCQTAIQDWRGLQAFLQPQDWAELEFIRHSFLAHALRGQELATAAKSEWEQALKAAGNRKESLGMLLRLAGNWKWFTEGEEILWSFVNRYPGEKWAFAMLNQVLIADGRTRSLMTLYSQQAKTAPADIAAKNNLAMTALLLDAKDQKPHELALEVYQKAPTNASFASTYAFSLYVQKKNAEALKILEQLKPQELEDPGIAGYYAMVLQATGNRAKAKKYFDLTAKARLLPEERKLIDQAKGM